MRKFLNFILFLAFITTIIPAKAANIPDMACKNKSKAQTSTIKSEILQIKEEKTQNYISKSQFPITATNPTSSTNPVGAYYPGLRAANQLLIYTPEFGQTTGTNEYGSEAIVVNGIVTDFTGSNTIIPQNGYVISGHGRASRWIKEKLIIGATVKIDRENKVIESIITPESYIFKANQGIQRVSQIIQQNKNTIKGYEAKQSEFYLNNAVKKINEAKQYIKLKEYDRVQEVANEAYLLSNQALYHAIPAKPGEFHGIWLRPTEKTREEIIQTLNKLQETGIHNVFLETYYQGYTIFPSKTLEKYGVISQRKEFQGWDPLKVWTEEAHKRNVKIHVWFQTFYVGNEDISKNPQHVLSVNPSWANVQKRNYTADKPVPSGSEHNGYFLDPANPQVQTYLLTLISEVANNYDIDGLNIDYIRYPVSLPHTFPNYLETTWGYTNYARSEFISLYGVDPVTLTQQDPLWQKWIDYRQSKITNLVANIKPVIKRNILVSTVVFPDIEESSINKLQNWKVWGNNRYVDAFTPLVMGSDESLAKNYVQQIKNLVGNNVYVYPGLFEPFISGSPADLLLQIESSRNAGASGIVIFDYAHLNQRFIDALGARAFKTAP
ncbi:MAG: hypothetical protein A2287_02195 [Candidatus Melainabacteria bacterium RIFOXYA12_FULL_32_12]|nr:MAG: hypothetical protein A2287_02195 [Candidatus Melainabacteria bacterium RIFOXYA12_FULL_32_12]